MIQNRPYSNAPIFVPTHDEATEMHWSWQNYFESLTQQLNQTLTPTGNIMPAVDQSTADLVEDQAAQKIIFNTDSSAFEANIDGAWETIVTSLSLTTVEVNSFEGTDANRVQLLYNKETEEFYLVVGQNKHKIQIVP